MHHRNKKTPPNRKHDLRSGIPADKEREAKVKSIPELQQSSNIGYVLGLQRTLGNQATVQLLQNSVLPKQQAKDIPNIWKPGTPAPKIETPRISPESGNKIDTGIQRSVSDLIKKHEGFQQEASMDQGFIGPELPASRNQTSLVRREHAHKIAVRQHEQDRQKLTEAVQQGRVEQGNDDVTRRLRNSCEWILKGKTKLFAITQTGDTDERIREAGMNPADDAAFFPQGMSATGPGHILDAPQDYNWQDLTDNAGVELDEDGKATEGWNDTGFVAITNASTKGRDAIWETIRHEVQHDSDRSAEKIEAGRLANTWDEEWESYKTEYRAYNYEGGQYDNLSHGVIENHLGVDWTEKQWAIFNGIYNGYEHTKELWDNAPNHYKMKIVNYKNPDSAGFNKYNSVRVDDFYNEVMQIPDGTDVETDPDNLNHPLTAEAQAVQNAIAVLNKLDSDDAQYILNEADDWTTLLNTKLTGGASIAIRNMLGNI